MGELVGDAAAGLGWGEPADRQAQRMQVHVAHSFKVKAVGIHEGLEREGNGYQMCHMYFCADACGVLMTETGNSHQLVQNVCS